MSNTKKILITGANGFTGRHLARILSSSVSLELHLADRTRPKVLDPRFELCDFSDISRVAECVARIEPREIYHLVGSYTNTYDADYTSNVSATRNILDTLRGLKLKSRVLLVGSSAEYGFPISKDIAVTEEHPCRPVSVYVLIKLFKTELMRAYIRLYGLDIVAVRPFNLFGKGMPPTLFVGKMEQEIARYKRGEIKEIVTGDLSVERDYIDIDEAIKYYQKVMECGRTGEMYNVGSGRSITLRDVVNRMLSAEGLPLTVIKEGLHVTSGKIVVHKIFADISKIKQI